MSKLKITEPITPMEKEFCEIVQYRAGIGYGRMMQMISGIWAKLLMSSNPNHDEGSALYAAFNSDSFYSEIVELEERIKHLEGCIEKMHDAVSGDNFASISVYKKIIAIYNDAEIPA